MEEEKVRWLSDEENRAWRGYLRMRALLDLQIARDLYATSGLSETDYHVLAVLSEHPEHRFRLCDLAQRMLWSQSRLSHQVGRMENRGLARREKGPSNDRATIVLLTELGLDTIRSAAPGHVVSVRQHFLDLLTDEQMKHLGDLAETVTAHLSTNPLRPQQKGS